jgi:hypothetical protein
MSNGSGSVGDIAVQTGPEMTPEQIRAVRLQDADEADHRVELLEQKQEQIKEALKEARDEAKRLRRRAEKGDE